MKDKLIATAIANKQKAYAPYSNFPVGAALLTADGEVFDGVNIENASYGMTICAERSAVAAAVSSGKRDFVAIAVACGDDENFCSPCGACRQVLAEFSPDLDVIMVNGKNKSQTLKISELLPLSFSLKGGKTRV